MVSLSAIQSSNSLIASSLPPRLVAVFVGATKGIGATSLKQFAKHARQPRAYVVGRSQDAGDRVIAECKALNPEGEYIFIKADASLIRVVDDVCLEIKRKEKTINLLFLSAGIIITTRPVTSESLHLMPAITYYSKFRFIVNLLPLLQQATALRRVVAVFAAGNEGPIDSSDFQALRVSALSVRGHLCSLITLGLEAVAKNAPNVSFVHNFPGMIETSILDDVKGPIGVLGRTFFRIMGRWICMPIEECGERHLFLATSTRFSPAETDENSGSGVPLPDGVAVAKGTNGKIGSGVYSIGADGESSGPKVEKLLAEFRNTGWRSKLGSTQRKNSCASQGKRLFKVDMLSITYRVF